MTTQLDQAIAARNPNPSPQHEVKFTPRHVTASVHEGVINSQHESGLAESARTALRNARQTLAAAYEAEGAIRRDPTLTPEARDLEAHDAVTGATIEALGLLAVTTDKLRGAVEARRKLLLDRARAACGRTSPPEEIRAYVADLTESARLSFLHRCAEQGDYETIAAVFDARAYLSGCESVSAETVEKIRERAARKRCPDEAEDLDEAQFCSNRVSVALAALEGEVPNEPPAVARTRKLRDARAASAPKRI